MAEKYVKISPTDVTLVEGMGKLAQETVVDSVDFFLQLSQRTRFDTGLLPLDGSGVLAIRHVDNNTQVVFQHAPGLYHVIWGKNERDPNARTYYVAQPYRIVIGDFQDGQLLGAKHFYSPYPITSLDQQLYHVNLPNLNCKGYSGNAVGWICLYHRENWSNLSFGEKVNALTHRASGEEAYNDRNMSGTDGPRFYREKYTAKLDSNALHYAYLWDPVTWEKKSTTEGFAWTLDENLWIPVEVESLDSQDKHVDGGQPLSLGMAMVGSYQAYYSDGIKQKLYNVFSRPDWNDPDPSVIYNMFATSAKKSRKLPKSIPGIKGAVLYALDKLSPLPNYFEKLTKPRRKIAKCLHSGTQIYEDDEYTEIHRGYVLTQYVDEYCVYSKSIGQLLLASNAVYVSDEEDFYPKGTSVYGCMSCGNFHRNRNSLVDSMRGCISCTEFATCEVSGAQVPAAEIVVIEARKGLDTDETMEIKVSSKLAGNYTHCECGLLVEGSTITTLPDGERVCGSKCIKYLDDGLPVYIHHS